VINNQLLNLTTKCNTAQRWLHHTI